MADNMFLNKVLHLDCIKQMKASVESAVKYGTIVGATTIVSSILGGRTGFIVGGVAGSLLAGYAANGKYESVPNILMYKLTTKEREELLNEIRDYLVLHGTSIRDFIYSASTSQYLQEGIKAIVASLLVKKGMTVQQDQTQKAISYSSYAALK
ncbi:uncharacterized protein LOC128888644 [Hylaeus anthracinus]|uniref:uncharacterized protein LOC128888644 n=1 Tax=Hylaeus anthracinus TaxID=313031 RepID=UPI0023BA016C|nr:uncharacterized protein LOC128888644 [Hylaeus anthracinus]